jgi:hypothetical protein
MTKAGRRRGAPPCDSADADLLIRQQHLDEALTELVVAGGSLTHSLLGAEPEE